MTKLSKKRGGSQTKSSKITSGFTNKPIFKSPFSSQRNKMKRKASSRRLVPAVFYSSTQKSREILELQKQLHVMQQKIRTIEDTQRSIQASTTVTLSASEQTRSKNEESKKKTFEDEVFQPSTSKKSNVKRKRRRDDASEEEQGNSYESLVCILLHFL